MPIPITKRQKEVLDFIKAFIANKGYSPTLEEIKKKLKLSAVSTVHQHIQALISKGFIKRFDNLARALVLNKSNEPRQKMIAVPLAGTISAGQPIEAIQGRDTVIVPQTSISTSPDIFALRVAGDSMIEENINDGDIVLVRRQAAADNGQKVVALIDNQEATLKKFYREKDCIRLQPANKTMEPIIIKKNRDFAIQGIVMDIVKAGNPLLTTQTTLLLPAKTKTEKPIKTYYEKNNFKLYLGNCLDILAAMPENSVDMIFADPPYNLSNNGFTVHAGRMVSVNKGDWDKSRGFKDDYDFHYKWLSACQRVLKPQGTLWVSGTYHSIYQCGHALQSLGYHILNDIAWFKPNASPNLSCRFFTASHETLIWARKDKKSKHTFNYDLMKNGNWPEDNLKKPGLQMRSVWSIGTPRPLEKKFGKHPTQKPSDLLRRIVLASTKKGDLVIDPFTGSSTTGLAAYLFGRKFIGIDTQANFLDLSIKRFEELDKNMKIKLIK